MRSFSTLHPRSVTQIEEPPIAKFFFAELTGHSIAIGSFGESSGTPWVFNAHAGAALQGFVKGALALTTGAHPSVQGWYAAFLQHIILPGAPVFAYVITFGEILVGLGLFFGVLTGIAAFFGVFMNMSYLFAGTVSINPVLGVLTIFLVLAWRIAGYYGGDRYLLPLLGTPWTGSLEKKYHEQTPVKGSLAG